MIGLIGQWPIYHLPTGERWRLLARAQSRTCNFLRDYILFNLKVCRDFFLDIEKESL